MTVPGWDEAYTASAPAPWDIGSAEPAFVRSRSSGLRPAAQCLARAATPEVTGMRRPPAAPTMMYRRPTTTNA